MCRIYGNGNKCGLLPRMNRKGLAQAHKAKQRRNMDDHVLKKSSGTTRPGE
jgi:hypothetical protein